MIKGKPFVKWAGGKRQIIDKLKSFVPDEFDTYYEPFVGGGALLFELSPKKAVINDYNKAVQLNPKNTKNLKKLSSVYIILGDFGHAQLLLEKCPNLKQKKQTN